MKRETQRHIDAFEAWYASDRGWKVVTERFHVSLTGARQWADAFDWRGRADARDQEAAKQAERAAIQRRVQVLEEQRRAGELLRRRGVQYYTGHEVEDGREAIAAISKGVELERQAENLPGYVVELLRMDEDELRRERERIIRAQAAGADRPAALGEGADAGQDGGEDDAEELEPA